MAASGSQAIHAQRYCSSPYAVQRVQRRLRVLPFQRRGNSLRRGLCLLLCPKVIANGVHGYCE